MGGSPTSFVLLARGVGSPHEGYHEKDVSMSADFEVWPLNERGIVEERTSDSSGRAPPPTAASLGLQQQVDSVLMPTMLQRMLASQVRRLAVCICGCARYLGGAARRGLSLTAQGKLSVQGPSGI